MAVHNRKPYASHMLNAFAASLFLLMLRDRRTAGSGCHTLIKVFDTSTLLLPSELVIAPQSIQSWECDLR